jgi:hypothetical protein
MQTTVNPSLRVLKKGDVALDPITLQCAKVAAEEPVRLLSNGTSIAPGDKIVYMEEKTGMIFDGTTVVCIPSFEGGVWDDKVQVSTPGRGAWKL